MNKVLLGLFFWAGISFSPVMAKTTILTNGQVRNGVVDKHQYQHYLIHASAGDTVKLDLSNQDADGDLYLKVGAKASLENFDCESDKGQTTDESCFVTLVEDADVYVAIYAFNCINNVQYKLSATVISKPAQLLFRSGFEQGIDVTGNLNGMGIEGQNGYSDDYKFIVGSDDVGTWPITILGAKDSGLHYVSDGINASILNNTYLDAYIDDGIGHNGQLSNYLFTAKYAEPPGGGSTQIPYEILNLGDKKGIKKDLYIRYWIKMGGDKPSSEELLYEPWRVLFEWKSKKYHQDEIKNGDDGYRDGFRLITYIYYDKDGVPFWVIKGDKSPHDNDRTLNTDNDDATWVTNNKQIPVPINEWFLTEFYWHWSDVAHGKVIWKVNGQVIANHSGPSTRNLQPIDLIMLTQTYGSQAHIFQTMDDIEVWEGYPARYKDTTELSAGDALSSFVEEEKSVQYIVSAKSGQTLRSTIDQLSADADVYIKVGSKATKNLYDCSSEKGGKSKDSCSVELEQNSDVYISVYGYQAANYHLKVDVNN